MNDITNLREAIQKYDEILIEVEILNKKLTENFKNYSNIDNQIKDNVDNQNNIIAAINSILEKTVNITEEIDKVSSSSSKIFKYQLNGLEAEINKAITTAINSVNTKDFRDKIDRLIDEKIEEIEDSLNKLNTSNKNIKDIKDDLNNIFVDLKDNVNSMSKDIKTNIKKENKELADLISNVNKINKITNIKVIAAAIGFGFIFGAALMFFYKNILSDYILESYKKDFALIEADYKEYQKFKNNNIKIITDKGNTYIVADVPSENAWINNKGVGIIQIK